MYDQQIKMFREIAPTANYCIVSSDFYLASPEELLTLVCLHVCTYAVSVCVWVWVCVCVCVSVYAHMLCLYLVLAVILAGGQLLRP